MLWCFENYRLDSDSGELWRGDEQIELRPKTFAVLQYLVEHAGDLVRKEALLETVWQDRYVVEGVLATSMSELRKLFGDTAKDQRFIATVHRRGYRFIAEISGAASDTPGASESAAKGSPSTAGRVSKFPNFGTLIGREKESRRLREQLTGDPDCRILSLIGPGGIGKSHLAAAVAGQISQIEGHPFSDGFCFARLQRLEKSDDFCNTILEALDLQSSGTDTPQSHLQGFLTDKRLLLVIDNFEYYLDLQSVLSELINAAPGIKILVTSRESLSIQDAWFHPVTGLDYSRSPDSDAVRLFGLLAQRNRPDFDLDRELAFVQRICEMVEGMPLALELAASWLRMLSAQEVAAEIVQGIDILSNQQTGESDRHGSIRAVFSETWQRLSENERLLLKQLSAFRGGSHRDAICNITGANLPLLARLVNKALLYTTHEMRYQMHELIRQYAEETLRADPQFETEARNRHAEYFLGFLENQYEPMCSDRQGEACDAVRADAANCRKAWYWALSQQQFDLLEGSIRMVFYYCDLRGLFRGGLKLFEAALERIETSDHPHKARILGKLKLRIGILKFRLSQYDEALPLLNEVRKMTDLDYESFYATRFLGDYHFSLSGYFTAEQSKAFLDECLAQGDRFGHNHTQTECFIQLAFLYINQIIDIEASQRYARQAVELARENGSPDLLASALHALAWTTSHRGDYAEAESYWKEALETATRVGNRRDIAVATNWLGWAAWSVGGGRLDEACELFAEGLQRYRDLGDRANEAMSYADLGLVLLEQDNLGRARESCRHGMELSEQVGREDHFVYNLFVLGAVECADGNLKLAHSLLANALKQAWGQEEETNKPAVVYYVIKLLYAEYCAKPEAGGPATIETIARLLRFMQVYPATWQAFRDRAAVLRQSIESETEVDVFAEVDEIPEQQLIQETLESTPGLLN